MFLYRRLCFGYWDTVNDQMSILGAYLKTKPFGWVLNRTWALTKR